MFVDSSHRSSPSTLTSTLCTRDDDESRVEIKEFLVFLFPLSASFCVSHLSLRRSEMNKRSQCWWHICINADEFSIRNSECENFLEGCVCVCVGQRKSHKLFRWSSTFCTEPTTHKSSESLEFLSTTVMSCHIWVTSYTSKLFADAPQWLWARAQSAADVWTNLMKL